MSTVLAQSGAYPVAPGPGSIGPFQLPAGAAGAQLVIQRAGLPAGSPLLTITGRISYDGGSTFVDAGGGSMEGGDIALPDGTKASASSVSFRWTGAPTHLSVDVDASAAFSADFTVEAL